MGEPHDDSQVSLGSHFSSGRQREVFSAAPHQDAQRWIRRMIRDLTKSGIEDKTEWVEEWNCSLEGEPAAWAEEDFRTKDIIAKEEGVTGEEWKAVVEAFIERWQRKVKIDTNPIPEIENLKQRQGEALVDYYQRASNLLGRTGADDTDTTVTNKTNRALLDMTSNRFVRGLADVDLCMRVMGQLPAAGQVRTLRGTFETARAITSTMEAEKEMRAAFRQKEELDVLRQVADAVATGTPPSAELRDRFQKVTGKAMPPQQSRTAPPAARAAFAPPPEPQAVSQAREVPFNTPASAPRTDRQNGAGPGGSATSATTMDPWTEAKSAVRSRHPNFEPAHSPNMYVAGGQVYRYQPDNPLCVKCGTTGHMSMECTGQTLSVAEQTFLWNLLQFQRQKALAIRDARAANAPPPVSALSNLLTLRSTRAQRPGSNDQSDSDDDAEAWGTTTSGPQKAQAHSVTVQAFDTMAEGGPAHKRGRQDGDEDVTTGGQNQPCEHLQAGAPECSEGRCDHQCCKRPIKPLKKTRRTKQNKPLKPIHAMEAERPIDVAQLLRTATVVMPVAHIAQLSPYFRAEAKRLLSLPRQRRTKKGAAVTGNLVEVPVRRVKAEVIEKIKIWCSQQNGIIRAFSLPAEVWTGDNKNRTRIPRNAVAADQGSDINLVYPVLLDRLALQQYPISQLNIPDIRMTVASGASYLLTNWVHLSVDVRGITRQVWAFVCPTNAQNLALLLGRPYLDDVDARFDIRANQISIGDKSRGEVTVTVEAATAREPTRVKIEGIEGEVAGDEVGSDEEEDSDEEGSSEGGTSEDEESDEEEGDEYESAEDGEEKGF